LCLSEWTQRLQIYKLRADVTITLQELQVLAFWDMEYDPETMPGLWFQDPRHPDLGSRGLVTAPEFEKIKTAHALDVEKTYQRHCLSLGIPQGGDDFPYGDTFPQDANMDLLQGVDFQKGCFIGQEVVSRIQHRGSLRKRIVPVLLDAPLDETPAPVPILAN